jgi:hypothetical protein
LEEILNLPDSIPQDLLNKAACVNVLVGADFTTVSELADLGVRRISVGGSLARAHGVDRRSRGGKRARSARNVHRLRPRRGGQRAQSTGCADLTFPLLGA